MLVAAVLPLLAATAALCASRVRRLHRLHIRLDAARAGLDIALTRRADAAAAAGVPGAGPAQAVERDPGDPARTDQATGGRFAGAAREQEANALARRLARLDRAALAPDVRAALTEAEELLVLARRVHNDAVRDTLGLRSRRLVRWLRLAGTAPMPAYFETAEPSTVGPAAGSDDRAPAGGDAVTSGTPGHPPA
jgi:hypothetical protein